MSSDTLDGTAVEVGQELVHHEAPPPTTLFRTDDPVEVVERASKVADALKSVLDKQGLTANISGKRHVLVEGWTTLGAMVGVTAVPVWTHALEGKAPEGREFGYEARVEARTMDGRVIGAAEAMCTRAEGRWKGADDYAIRSMAQTRATSKALRGPLGFVVTLAGYESTPADEMPPPAAATPPREPLDGATETEVRLMIADLLKAGVWDGKKMTMHLVAAGATTRESVEAAVRSLTPDGAEKLKHEMADLLAAAASA